MNNSRTRKAMSHLARANELLDVGSSLGFGSLEFVKEFVMIGKRAKKGDDVQLILVPHKRLPQRQIVCTVKSLKASDKNMSSHLVDKSVTFKYNGEENDTHNWSLVFDAGEGWSCNEGQFIGYTWTSSKGFKDLYTAQVEMNLNANTKEFERYMIKKKKYMEWEDREQKDDPPATLDEILEYIGPEPDEVDPIKIKIRNPLRKVVTYNFNVKNISMTEPDGTKISVLVECEAEDKGIFGSKVKFVGEIEQYCKEFSGQLFARELYSGIRANADKFRLFLRKIGPEKTYANKSELMQAA